MSNCRWIWLHGLKAEWLAWPQEVVWVSRVEASCFWKAYFLPTASAGPCGHRAEFWIGRKRCNWNLHGHRVIRKRESRDGSLGVCSWNVFTVLWKISQSFCSICDSWHCTVQPPATGVFFNKLFPVIIDNYCLWRKIGRSLRTSLLPNGTTVNLDVKCSFRYLCA